MLMLILNVVRAGRCGHDRADPDAAWLGAAAGSALVLVHCSVRGASNFLSKSTKWLAVVFFGISLFMAWYAGHGKARRDQDLGLMSAPAKRAGGSGGRTAGRSEGRCGPGARFRRRMCRLRRNLRFLVKKSLRKAPRNTEAGYNTRRIGKIV